MCSKSSTRHHIYDAIHALAQPGDICFFISIDPQHFAKLSLVEKLYRRWMGFAPNDITIWHVGMLSKFEKKSHSAMVRPYFIHSTKERGVFEQHIAPEYFTSYNIETGQPVCQTVMEILRCTALSPEQSAAMVAFCRARIGRPFPKSIRGESLTYIFGLPNIFNPPDQYSCHSLIFLALDHVGITFPHHLESAPPVNLGKLIGHPYFHPAHQVDQRFPYLRDHHIYQDARFSPVISLSWNLCSDSVHIQANPSKFSWNTNPAAL